MQWLEDPNAGPFFRLIPCLDPSLAARAAREGAVLALLNDDLASVSHFCQLGAKNFERASLEPQASKEQVTIVGSPSIALLFLVSILLSPVFLARKLKRAR